jgi:ribonuclease P protein component
MSSVLRLRKRADFLRCAEGRKRNADGMTVQRRARAEPAAEARVGFTVSKKNGNAVKRNRIRRRLKAALDRLPADALEAGIDYVIVGRSAALTLPFLHLADGLAMAISSLNRKPDQSPPAQSSRRDRT